MRQQRGDEWLDSRRGELRAAFVAGYLAAKPDVRAEDSITRSVAERRARQWIQNR